MTEQPVKSPQSVTTNLHAKMEMGRTDNQRSLKDLNSFWTTLISFRFHSPLQVELFVTQTFDERSKGWSGVPEKSTDMLRLLPASFVLSTGCAFSGKTALTLEEEGFLDAKTSWGGTISPSVCVSLAIRFLRLSAGVGNTGVIGVMPHEADDGVRVSAVEGVGGRS